MAVFSRSAPPQLPHIPGAGESGDEVLCVQPDFRVLIHVEGELPFGPVSVPDRPAVNSAADVWHNAVTRRTL